MSWWRSATCRDTDVRAFYPERARTMTVTARKLCGRCPVRQACLDDALSRGGDLGIWGGLSERERRQLKRGRRMA